MAGRGGLKWLSWLVIGSLFWTLPAWAGEIGKFRDAVAPDDDNDRKASSSHSHQTASSTLSDPSEEGLTGDPLTDLFFFLRLLGDCPGHGFDYGPSPYNVIPGTTPDLVPRNVFWRTRAAFLTLFEEQTLGFSVFTKVESSFTPGFFAWHDQLFDSDSSDRLGITTIGIEPRILTMKAIRVFWTIGTALYWDQSSLVNGGGLLGVGIEAWPVQPLLVEFRVGGHFVKNRQVLDLYLGTGLDLAGPLFVTIGYRYLKARDVDLNLGSFGLSLTLGL